MFFKRLFICSFILFSIVYQGFSQCDFVHNWKLTDASVSKINKTIISYENKEKSKGTFKFEFYNVFNQSLTYSKTTRSSKVELNQVIDLGAYAVLITHIETGCSSFISHGKEPFLTFKKGIPANNGGAAGVKPSSCDTKDGAIDYTQEYFSETSDDIIVEVYKINTKEKIHTETFEGEEGKHMNYGFTILGLSPGLYVAKIYTTNPSSKYSKAVATVSFDMDTMDNCTTIDVTEIMKDQLNISSASVK